MNQNRFKLLYVIGILFSLNAPAAFAQAPPISLRVDATLAIVLSEMDSWRGRAGRPHRELDGPEIHRERKDDSLAARSARQLYVSRQRAVGRGSSRCHV
jgi:hypothetical protein